MNMTRDRVQSIVWTIVVMISAALLAALTFRVNAVKSRVRLTERRIVAIQQEKQSLDTEFQTRANQQQLAAMNAVEFGLKAPTAAQYVGGERQLAALSAPVAPAFTPGTQAPVRMASVEVPVVPSASVHVPAARVITHMAVADQSGSAGHADFADRMARTVQTASVRQPSLAIHPAAAVRVASAMGSLPRVLGPMANRGLTVGAGTRLLSDRDEVRVKPAKHSSLARVETPGPAHPAIKATAPKRPLPAHLAIQDTAVKKGAPTRVSAKDTSPRKLAPRQLAPRQLAQAKPSPDSGPSNLLPANWDPVKQVRTKPASKHATSERLALAGDARADTRSAKR